MSEPLRMRVGQKQQLHAHGDVSRWTSSDAKVVQVSDADIVNGRPGGELTAVAKGNARIKAVGFADETMVDLEVAVEAAAEVVVQAGSTLPLPSGAATSRWTSPNTDVVEISDDQVRGVGPGIITLRGEGQQRLPVRVEGTLQLQVGQEVDLAARFDVPVRGWRSSSEAAAVDAQGRLRAGDRPRTVPIVVSLDGSQFTFDVRITRPSAPAAPTAPAASSATTATDLAAPPASAPARPVPDSLPAPAPPAGGPSSVEVDTHLAQAEYLIGQQRWEEAGARVAAARVAAVDDRDLLARAERLHKRLTGMMVQHSTSQCMNVATLLREHRFDEARRTLTGMTLPGRFSGLPERLGELADALLRIEADGYNDTTGALLGRRLDACWHATIQSGAESIILELLQIAGDYGVVSLASTIAATIESPAVIGASAQMRQKIFQKIDALGPEVLIDLFQRLSTLPSDGRDAPSLAQALAAMAGSRHVGHIVAEFAAMNEPQRAAVVRWAALMASSAPKELFDLLAGTLAKLPRDLKFPRAVKAAVGGPALEDIALRWAAGGNKAARVVLQHLYDYSPSAFSN